MSGLFGAFACASGRLPPDLGAQMERALSAIPCDASGFAELGPVLLGARIRWFTYESAGHVPPYVDADTGLCVVFDGRLDRRHALAEKLRISEAGVPDAGLVAAAYRKLGEGCVSALDGDFAFALWDPQQQTLLLGRDVLGVRPLYWTREGELLLFASQPRALWAHQTEAREPDRLRLAQYLVGEFADAKRSFFSGISRLEPAHLLIARSGAAPSVRRYFQFDARSELPRQSRAEYAEEFRARFLSAVQERARSRVPLGCLLSGGLDSSGLLAALTQLAPESSIAAYSARFPDFPHVDEGAWLALLPTSPLVSRHEFRADRVGPLESVDALHAALDEPFHAPNLFIYDGLARLAEGQGTRVLLDGLDGDTAVDHGYGFLRELFFMGRPRRLARALRDLHQRMGFSYTQLLSNFTFGHERDQIQRFLVQKGLLRRGYLSRAFAQESGLRAAQRDAMEHQVSLPRTLRHSHHAALTHPILPYYLESYDKAAAALGIDHRHPYFDRSLLTFCLALPGEERLHRGWDRVVQRRAFEGLIPEPIRLRQSKSVWTDNFERKLFEYSGPRIAGLIESDESPLRGYCDLPRLRRDLPRLKRGQLRERVVDFWCVLTLGCWLQTRL